VWTHIEATVACFIVRAEYSGRAIRTSPEKEGQAELLHWCKKKGVRLAANRAVACDLADIVNPVGLFTDPAGVWRNKPVNTDIT